ncbi:YaiO family outer membrane beta-barrel protein [Gilliamella sp. B2776]|uniref:YaiO family outer membrane beta-barrel protein n=1 Tax=unclassified Gilliamella TaxID=2685620 RepID=UPI00226AEF5C|nr:MULTISPECIES: YaiO family outer membrane beta-barrel protein [unclassified Gilliamella]MCX8650711.1 YaiO family outer membrane beta-barrel protein [Gilliamella sp. B2779]MCX8654328.1 YaiO family outer membrane beta-barrel protein [Gilliamella sp. B2737]MCX8665809.1 YaiO family outer membrane beta-barrel protein [Gilliamella sp. B2887]MCX8692559.1 YaiO family outer membrane beta-barrel protein [Gilliamella sp. B2776]MCX8698106.1 YaiO family outer membrane beta-barrel protein [Gilliamella sp.
MFCKIVLIISILTYSSSVIANTNDFDNAVKADQLLKESIEAKKFQNYDLSLSKLQLAYELSPTNSDILVQLGFNYYALGKLDQAKQSFQDALSITPDYIDAQYGLVSVILAQNPDDPNKAEKLLNQYLEQSPNDIQLLTISKSIEAVKNSIHNWEFNLGGTHSHLSKSYADWNEMEMALSYKLSKTDTITGYFAQSHRFHMNDQKYGGTLWHTFNNKAYGYLTGFVSSSNKLFAKYTLINGIDYTLFNSINDDVNSFHVTLDLKLDHYNDGNIKSIDPGITQYFFGERLSLSGKWNNTFDQDNKHMSGFLVKIAASPTEKLRLFAGYSNSQETSDRSSNLTRSLIKVTARFVGLSYDITEIVTLNLNYTDEDRKETTHNRKLYNKKTLGCGIKWIF